MEGDLFMHKEVLSGMPQFPRLVGNYLIGPT